ncbi:MAG: hypothetical protein ACREKS_12370 [Candidatus Rokuibacteriota bacterium]
MSTRGRAGGTLDDAVLGSRAVHFQGTGITTTPCYARGRLREDLTFEGPAVVDQDDATTLVPPGFRARIDRAHHILLERA